LAFHHIRKAGKLKLGKEISLFKNSPQINTRNGKALLDNDRG